MTLAGRAILVIESTGGADPNANPPVGPASAAVLHRYLHHDSLSSITAISDAQGLVIERLRYDPWGVRLGAGGWGEPELSASPRTLD